MKKSAFFLLSAFLAIKSFGQIESKTMSKEKADVACKLTTPELQERLKTVIASIKKLVVERVETTNGFRYSFLDSDSTINLLVDFIKTERQCCPFFTFSLVVGQDENHVYLELSGPEGAKDFIQSEAGM